MMAMVACDMDRIMSSAAPAGRHGSNGRRGRSRLARSSSHKNPIRQTDQQQRKEPFAGSKLRPTKGDQNDRETQQGQTPARKLGSVGSRLCRAFVSSQDDPEDEGECLAGKEGEAPTPDSIFHEEAADQRPGERRDSPKGRNGRHRARDVAAWEDQADRDEAHGHQTSAAESLQGASRQKQRHGRADGAEDTAEPEQGGAILIGARRPKRMVSNALAAPAEIAPIS